MKFELWQVMVHFTSFAVVVHCHCKTDTNGCADRYDNFDDRAVDFFRQLDFAATGTETKVDAADRILI